MYYNNISNDDDIEIIYWGNEEENNTVNSDKIKKHRKKKDDYDWKKEAMGFLKIIAIAVVIAFAINNLVIINAKVPSGSMEKTIKKHSRMVGFRLSYVFSKPKSGDIIIFKYPEDESQNFVKRVIATPEDVVEINNGVVYVNGGSRQGRCRLLFFVWKNNTYRQHAEGSTDQRRGRNVGMVITTLRMACANAAEAWALRCITGSI